MKAFFICTLILISNFYIIPQSGGENPTWNDLEIFMLTNGLVNETIRYEMEAVSTVWHTNDYSDYFITTDYNQAYYPLLTYDETENSDWSSLVQLKITTFGYNWIPSGPFFDYDNFTYGVYKISNTISDQYFYLDYRDDRYPLEVPPYVSAPGGNDIWVLYNRTTNKFYYRATAITSPTDPNWIALNKGDYKGIWQIKGVGTPTSSRFPNFWQNCLSLVDNGSSCPRLIWGAYPNNNVTVLNYKVYRSVTNDTYPPPADNFLLLETKACSVFTHEDYQYTFHGPFTLKYRVKAFVRDASNNEYETEATNVVQTSGGFYKETRKEIKEFSTQILSNYPNPFNPTTTITYKLNESGNVRLVVTNSLGEEVKVIDSGLKEVGEYSAVFNSENLPSGIYICSLITNQRITSNKMLLLR